VSDPDPPLDLPDPADRPGRSRRNRRLLLAAAVAVAALVGGGTAALLTGDTGTPTAAAPPAITPSAAPSPAAPAASDSPTEPPAAGPAPSPSEPEPLLTEMSGDAVFFRSPSDNIGCQMTATSAACDLRENEWEVPPRPDDCEFDYGQGVLLDGEGSGLTCASDTPFTPDAPVLEYGTGWVLGVIRCVSSQEGVTCEDTETGRGFRRQPQQLLSLY
jgi:hypothetical protein